MPLGNDQHSRKPILEHYRISDRNTEYQLVFLPSRSKILASCPRSVVCLYCLTLVRGRLAAWAPSHPASEHLSEGLNGVKVPSGWGQMDFPSESEDGTSLGLPNDATRKGEKKAPGGGGEAGKRRAIGDWGRNVSLLVGPSASLCLEEALLRFRLKFWLFYGYR